jgi:SAM-dependent methyltransferase
MKKIIDFYDDTAQSWADRWYNIETFIPYLVQFLTILPKSPRIVELCCGTGYDTMRLNKLGATVVGLDLSKGALEIARERNPNIQFYLQNILQDYSYVGLADGILCCAGLIHLSNDEMKVAFQQMYKVIKDGGHLFLVVYDGTGKRLDWQYKTIDGITYDRTFYRHSLYELKDASAGMFTYIQEFEHEDDDKWRYYIFKK